MRTGNPAKLVPRRAGCSIANTRRQRGTICSIRIAPIRRMAVSLFLVVQDARLLFAVIFPRHLRPQVVR